MGPGLATSHAPLLAASGSTLTAVVVTIVVLLLLGLVFWSFLRRGSVSGIAPLAVDRRAAPRALEPVARPAVERFPRKSGHAGPPQGSPLGPGRLSDPIRSVILVVIRFT